MGPRWAHHSRRDRSRARTAGTQHRSDSTRPTRSCTCAAGKAGSRPPSAACCRIRVGVSSLALALARARARARTLTLTITLTCRADRSPRGTAGCGRRGCPTRTCSCPEAPTARRCPCANRTGTRYSCPRRGPHSRAAPAQCCTGGRGCTARCLARNAHGYPTS